ncbi:MAG: hypothetical protein V1725_03870 [archaeon]
MRAQASFEFLTTYGWAILVILIAAGALAYFGVFNPGQYIPNQCEISPELSCVDYTVTHDSVQFMLLNNYEKSIDITDVLASHYTAGNFTCTPSTTTLLAGSTGEFNCTSSTYTFSQGEKADIKVEVTFRRTGGTQEYTVRGRILMTVG